MSKQTSFDKLDLLGVEIDALTIPEAIDYICNHAAPGQPARYVVKPYVEFLDRAYHNQPLQDTLNNAELCLPDGIALIWAAHYLYAGKRNWLRYWKTLIQIILTPDTLRWPLPDRIAGINFTWPLLTEAANRNLTIYLVGSPKNGDISQVTRALRQKLPQLRIAGAHSGRDHTQAAGRVSPDWLQALTIQIQHTQPDIILIGTGFPLQETICAHLSTHTNHGVYIGEGGSFDYEQFGGTRPKAPATIQRVGLEWLWRLLQEPWRLRRQLAIPRFLWRVWRNR